MLSRSRDEDVVVERTRGLDGADRSCVKTKVLKSVTKALSETAGTVTNFTPGGKPEPKPRRGL